MGLFDVHAHLTHPRFDEDRDAVIERARVAGLTSIVVNGLNPADNEAVRALAARESLVRPAFGFYPVDTVLVPMRQAGVEYPREGPDHTAEEGIAWVRANAASAFAIGEIGLDGHWVPEPFWPEQERVFCELVRIAQAADKPVIVHTRRRERRTLELLDELGATRVNWHCFGGKVKLARQIAERGHFLSIPANARRSESFTRMLETLPRDRLLLETDCPYLAPEPGTRCEPALVTGTAAFAAELWKVPFDSAVATFEANFEALFRAPP